MEIQQEDSKLSGTFEAQGGSKPLNRTLQGNRVSRKVGGERRAINLTGMVEGDKMSGTTEQGSSWSATRPGGKGFGTQTRSRCVGWRRRRWRNAVSAHGKPTSKRAGTHALHASSAASSTESHNHNRISVFTSSSGLRSARRRRTKTRKNSTPTARMAINSKRINIVAPVGR